MARLHSQNQHRVAVAEEPVLACDRVGVDFAQPRNAVGRTRREECRNETKQGGAGWWKLVMSASTPRKVARVEEQIGLAQKSRSRGPGCTEQVVFDGAHGGRANGDATTGRVEQRLLVAIGISQASRWIAWSSRFGAVIGRNVPSRRAR